MKHLVSLVTLGTIALAAPRNAPRNPEDRANSVTSNDLTQGCQPAVFIMARGSTEQGNMGAVVGGPLCTMLKMTCPVGIACQGVGGAYTAQLAPNTLPKGTDDASINEAVNLIQGAMKLCPASQVILAGYSQGSAVMLNAVMALTQNQKNKVAGVAFYGYTKNEQTNGTLPGYPDQDLKVFCRPDDGVCGGKLNVTAGHLAYDRDGSVGEGAQFLVSKISASLSKGQPGISGEKNGSAVVSSAGSLRTEKGMIGWRTTLGLVMAMSTLALGI